VIFHQDLIENKPSLVQEHIGRVDSALALSSKDHEFESHWNRFFLGVGYWVFFLNHVFRKYFCLFVCLFFFILALKRSKRNVATFPVSPLML